MKAGMGTAVMTIHASALEAKVNEGVPAAGHMTVISPEPQTLQFTFVRSVIKFVAMNSSSGLANIAAKVA